MRDSPAGRGRLRSSVEPCGRGWGSHASADRLRMLSVAHVRPKERFNVGGTGIQRCRSFHWAQLSKRNFGLQVKLPNRVRYRTSICRSRKYRGPLTGRQPIWQFTAAVSPHVVQVQGRSSGEGVTVRPRSRSTIRPGTEPTGVSLWSCQGTDAVPGVARVRKVLRESLVVCGGSGQAASSSRMVRRL